MLTRNQHDHSLSGNPTRGTWPSAWPIPRRPGSTSLSVISTAPGWRARSRRSARFLNVDSTAPRWHIT